ncbi:MAG: tyrosine-type recombinase/integrase [Acidobacteria bacterium]|nr:tyrosine-type recombinase/integrase [Acidobacteriota bacterium]MYH23222.1 tyrosine-type recombinase/integrase [Acidobacteriota bacterium]MYK78725.1 tyrosine-type recombinase/integrase [Acidobacteriota bacterium]
MGTLTVARAKSLSEPGLHRADPTLYLRIAPGGSKSWVQRLTIEGRRHDLGLGGFPLVTLAEARAKAYENRRLARSGGDPLAAKRRAKTPTFRQAASRTCDALRPRWRNHKHATDWMATLERHAYPVIGDMSVDRIRREDVLRTLTPIWTRRPETARRVRQRMRAVLRWCWAHGYVSENVAGEGIDGALPKMPAVRQHFRALPYSEVATALETVEASRVSKAAKLCLRFLVLTAARSGEARGATWAEVDAEAREWRIPGDRMKRGAEHRVPLSDAALAVLERARRLDDGSGLIFPSALRPGHSLSNMTLTKILRDQGLAGRTTVHGFRSAFRDWCAETGKPREIAEAALAHTVGGVEGAYFRSDLFARRRVLMDQWSAFLTEAQGKVVRLYG